MLTYQIRKNKSRYERSTAKAAEVPLETKEESFRRHYAKLFLRVGDTVTFKKPRSKRNRIRGVVEYIETDISKMHWSSGGMVPHYIKVKVTVKDKQGNEESHQVWTCQNKLVYTGK